MKTKETIDLKNDENHNTWKPPILISIGDSNNETQGTGGAFADIDEGQMLSM